MSEPMYLRPARKCPMCEKDTLLDLPTTAMGRYNWQSVWLEDIILPTCVNCGCQPVGREEAKRMDAEAKRIVLDLIDSVL